MIDEDGLLLSFWVWKVSLVRMGKFGLYLWWDESYSIVGCYAVAKKWEKQSFTVCLKSLERSKLAANARFRHPSYQCNNADVRKVSNWLNWPLWSCQRPLLAWDWLLSIGVSGLLSVYTIRGDGEVSWGYPLTPHPQPFHPSPASSPQPYKRTRDPHASTSHL